MPAAAVLAGALVWLNWPEASDVPTGLAAGNGRLELARLDVATLYPGRVEYRIAEPGNVLGAGSRVVTLLDPGEASMALFLPTPVVSGLKVGDEARIVLDGLDAVWPATVRFIASEAQFTPKHVETADERNKMVYRVKLVLPEDVARRHDGLLKGGLTGVGYVRHKGTQGWPAELAVRLPD